MVGRKSNSKTVGGSSYLPVELYTISHNLNFTYGSKRKIRGEDGTLLPMRQHIGGTYTKEQADVIVLAMKKDKLKNIKLHKSNFNLPKKCPSCHNNGQPNIYLHKAPYRINDSAHGIKRESLRLVYNHSNTTPKTCVVGTVVLDSPIPQILLKRGLPIDSLGHRRRVGVYPL